MNMAPPSQPLPSWLAEPWPDALLLTDASGVIQYVNRAFETLTGYRRREVLGRTPALLKSGHLGPHFYRRMWRELRRGRPFRAVFLNRRKNGELFYEEQTIRALRGPDGSTAYFLSAGRDVSQVMREIGKLQYSATHDPLTSLPNRTLFADRLAQALREARRQKGRVAVAIADVDALKRVNTRHGHLAGDAVLKAVAKRTQRCLREVDTVARIGGDEFALVLPAMRSPEACVRVLEKIRSVNARPVRYGGEALDSSLSIGASFYPQDGGSDVTLRRRADAALYEAKKAGGNAWRFAAPVRGSASARRRRSSRGAAGSSRSAPRPGRP